MWRFPTASIQKGNTSRSGGSQTGWSDGYRQAETWDRANNPAGAAANMKWRVAADDAGRTNLAPENHGLPRVGKETRAELEAKGSSSCNWRSITTLPAVLMKMYM